MPETYCGQQGWEVVEVYQDDGYTGMNMERPALQRILEAQKGQFTGCLAPFGYRKDPADKNHLLIDEKAAPIVRQIFGWAMEGHGPNFIRRRLEEQRIPCPTWWNRYRGMRDTFTKKKLYRFKIGAIGDKRPEQIYACKTYNAYGKNHCSQYRVEYDVLYKPVLDQIRECAELPCRTRNGSNCWTRWSAALRG